MAKLFIQLALLGLLIAAGQFGLVALFPPPPASLVVREMLAARKPGIVYLGDSVNAFVSAGDTNVASVSRMLQNKLGRRVLGISRGGFDLLLFRDFVRDWVLHVAPPRTVVVEVNLAVLGGDGRTPFSQHHEIAFELRRQSSRGLRAFDRPLHIFRVPALRPAIRLEEFLHQDVVWLGRTIGKERDFEDVNFLVPEVTDDLVRTNLIIRYGQPIAPGNRLLAAATDIAKELTARGHRAVFFITPVNYQRCDGYWSGAISPILREKASAVHAAVAAGGGELLDFTFALGPEYFDPAHYPNEHLQEAGRDYVAQALANHLQP
jgi:hypothetical protein